MTTISPAAALKIAQRLRALEREIDGAARSSARLPADLLDELFRAGAKPIEAQRVIDAATETLAALVEARGKVARTHTQLLAYARDAGLLKAFGDQVPCDEFVRGLADAARPEGIRIAA